MLWFSLGVVCYILLCGFPPFFNDDLPALYETIKAGDYEFMSPYWDANTDLCKDFVCRMLCVDRVSPARSLWIRLELLLFAVRVPLPESCVSLC
jgi:serine/threonine protein kinase